MPKRKKVDPAFVCLGQKNRRAGFPTNHLQRKFGFEVVDTTDNGYELLALSFDGTVPQFAPNAKNLKIESEELTIYYDMQCPYIDQKIGIVKQYCEMNDVPLSLILVDTLQKAKELPCVFNNWAVFYKGKFETVNLIQDVTHLREYLRNESIILTSLQSGRPHQNSSKKFIIAK